MSLEESVFVIEDEDGGGASALQRHVDVSPIAGRLVLFPSASMLHEVLPTSAAAGERLALTLWVESLCDA